MPSFFNHLNIFRNINIERDLLGRFGGAFAPRGENNRQPSYFSAANNNPYLNAASNAAGSVNPFVGWLSQGVGAGLLAGFSSGNPLIGVTTGGASLLKGIPSLIGNVQKKKAADKAKAEQTERLDRLRSIDNGQKDLNARYTDLLAEMKATREAFASLRPGGTNPEVVQEQNKEAQQISKEINEQIANSNTVNRYNNLQIQRTASFTLNSLPPVVRKRQSSGGYAIDRLGRRNVMGNFFALV